MSPYKNTSVSTGKKYKHQVFCLNLMDSVKYIQLWKVKLLVLSLYTFPQSPQNGRQLFMDSVFEKYMKMCLFFHIWTHLLPTAPLKCWNLLYSWVVLQVAIYSFTTRCHPSSTLDCNDHALSFCYLGFFWVLFFLFCRILFVMSQYWAGSGIYDAIYYNMIISSAAQRISVLETGYKQYVPTFWWFLIEWPYLR